MCLVLLSMDPSPIIVYDSLNSVTNYFCWALTGVTLADGDRYPIGVDGLTWAMHYAAIVAIREWKNYKK